MYHNFELRFYATPEGQKPFLDWLENLKDKTVRYRVKERLYRAELGNLGDYKSVGEGVYEMRLAFGSGYRIYFAKNGKQIILLLSAGNKASQVKDIKQAKLYWQNYVGEIKNA